MFIIIAGTPFFKEYPHLPLKWTAVILISAITIRTNPIL
jgi:uncharacterized membrane protein YkvI